VACSAWPVVLGVVACRACIVVLYSFFAILTIPLHLKIDYIIPFILTEYNIAKKGSS